MNEYDSQKLTSARLDLILLSPEVLRLSIEYNTTAVARILQLSIPSCPGSDGCDNTTDKITAARVGKDPPTLALQQGTDNFGCGRLAIGTRHNDDSLR